jgi:quercetin dioxygenase-like cupin family protein
MQKCLKIKRHASGNLLGESMNQRIDLIKEDNARVTCIDLGIGEESPWHFHTELVENVVCLSGHIDIQFNHTNAATTLKPGERHEINAIQIHRLVNIGNCVATYLLVQSGKYDFVPIDTN